jgi:DNA ligase-1
VNHFLIRLRPRKEQGQNPESRGTDDSKKGRKPSKEWLKKRKEEAKMHTRLKRNPSAVVMKHLAHFSVTVFVRCLSIFITASAFSYFAFAGSPLPSFNPSEKSLDALVMLARKWNPEIDPKGWWMSEKFDGVRGFWTGEKLMSRSGNVIHAPEWFTADFPSTPLDGELWTKRQDFSRLAGIVRQKTPDSRWKKVRYLIFDAPQVKGRFENRINFAQYWFQQHPKTHVEIIEQQLCESKDHLRKKLLEIERLGGEGLILRKPGSSYSAGKSLSLLKVKTYEDSEGAVIGHLPGSGKHKGRLGALLIQLPNGIQFGLGSGFSDQEREKPPSIGSIVTFKYSGFHKSGIPRFASFLRIRQEI